MSPTFTSRGWISACRNTGVPLPPEKVNDSDAPATCEPGGGGAAPGAGGGTPISRRVKISGTISKQRSAPPPPPQATTSLPEKSVALPVQVETAGWSESPASAFYVPSSVAP